MSDTDGTRLESQPADAFGTIDDLDCRGRRVFLRLDPYAIEALAPARGSEAATAASAAAPPASSAVPAPPRAAEASSLRRLIELEARIVIGTHLSREAAEETGTDSLEALGSRLSERLQVEVLMPDECVGDAVVRVIHDLRQGQVCVLPDLSSVRGEASNDEAFARTLAGYVDAYVGDAFSASHLEYASLVRLPRLAPRRALGYRARRELMVLSRLMALPRRALALAVGGRLFSEKVDLIDAWLPRLEQVCVGGGMALTLLAALGKVPAEASAEPDRLAQARSFVKKARDLGVEVLLPVDFRVQFGVERHSEVVRPERVPAEARIVDIGPESMERFATALGTAEHLLWWGPFGNLQNALGRAASQSLAELCASPDIASVVLGSDTRRFVRQLPPEIEAGIELVCSGSAAAKTLLSQRRLPAIEALRVRQ